MDRPSTGMRSLVIDMEAGESLQVTVPPSAAGDLAVHQTVRVQMLAKSGKRARVRVLAAPGVQVQRTDKDAVPVPG